MLGFDRLLPLVESVDTYVNVPVELADRLASPLIVTMSQILHHCKRGSRNWIMMMIQYAYPGYNLKSEFMQKDGNFMSHTLL